MANRKKSSEEKLLDREAQAWRVIDAAMSGKKLSRGTPVSKVMLSAAWEIVRGCRDIQKKVPEEVMTLEDLIKS